MVLASTSYRIRPQADLQDVPAIDRCWQKADAQIQSAYASKSPLQSFKEIQPSTAS